MDEISLLRQDILNLTNIVHNLIYNKTKTKILKCIQELERERVLNDTIMKIDILENESISCTDFIKKHDGQTIKFWKYYIFLQQLKSLPKNLLDDFDKDFNIISFIISKLAEITNSFNPNNLSEKDKKHYERICMWWII